MTDEVQRAEAAERSEIVAWLRQAAKKPVPCNADDALLIAANMIEGRVHKDSQHG